MACVTDPSNPDRKGRLWVKIETLASFGVAQHGNRIALRVRVPV
jgi:hypothetical protein